MSDAEFLRNMEKVAPFGFKPDAAREAMPVVAVTDEQQALIAVIRARAAVTFARDFAYRERFLRIKGLS